MTLELWLIYCVAAVGLSLTPGPNGLLSLTHGACFGFRFGALAYAPDVSRMPEESIEALRGLEVLVIDALRYTPHPSHFSVAEALALIETVRPQRAILTNLHTDLDYETLRRELPPGVEPAYDGMRIETA